MDSDADDEQHLQISSELKGPKKATASFASMGLSRLVQKAILRKGYKLATPIQRKCIPPIMLGRDVVAMARTGSGKSAAFLLPMVDKLKARQAKEGIRALVISPTRELATQTFKFAREFSKYTTLVPKIIIGGESISQDFETMSSSPDILIATPGRLAHVLVEMKLKLNSIEVVVFDEADRLFEPGYKEMEQVNEICHRLPDSKQTLLFSATMPQKLADFAKAGLNNPVFVRLDVECNLSETLKCVHLHCNSNDKFAILMNLLKNFIRKGQMTVVFMPTKHHVEYARMLLEKARIDCTYVYSSLDPEARKINVSRFTNNKCNVMLVTDIAARGIDIPLLDIVINFNFPFKPKLYIHRVGRVARAGRFGAAISLIAHDETPYLHAQHIFFSIPLTLASELDLKQSNCRDDLEKIPHMILGTVPQHVLDNENDILKKWHEHDEELLAMVKVCDNAMKPYLKTRAPAEAASGNAAKELHKKVLGIHPIFSYSSIDSDRDALLRQIKNFKPKASEVQVSNDPLVKASKKSYADDKYYIKYKPDDSSKEKGLEIDQATMDLMADDENNLKSQNRQVWDRKKKKYVNPQSTNDRKKIRSESGALISASYRSGLFEKWKSHSKYDGTASNDDADDSNNNKQHHNRGINKLRNKLLPKKKKRYELKSNDEILKQRNKDQKNRMRFSKKKRPVNSGKRKS